MLKVAGIKALRVNFAFSNLPSVCAFILCMGKNIQTVVPLWQRFDQSWNLQPL